MITKFLDAADELSGEMSKHFFAKVREEVESVGNVVNLRGGELTPEAILQVLEKLVVDFDERGYPVWPTIVTAPEKHEATEAAWRELEENPRYRSQFKELIQRKFEEYRVRESNRRLVD